MKKQCQVIQEYMFTKILMPKLKLLIRNQLHRFLIKEFKLKEIKLKSFKM